jgi:hypothetical protein
MDFDKNHGTELPGTTTTRLWAFLIYCEKCDDIARNSSSSVSDSGFAMRRISVANL